MTLLDRIMSLMEERNLKPAQLTREIEISHSSFTDWKRGKGNPSLEVVAKFAKYFNVSIDYLVNGEEFKDPFRDKPLELSNNKERQCIIKFRKLTPELQDKLLIYADGMLAAMPESDESLEYEEEKLSV